LVETPKADTPKQPLVKPNAPVLVTRR